ncbi:MAG TPA: GNAT family N-acetyltransferase [Candidatus Saccharibacteria bacterium]|nr:GNAT family N-acetyltransferase [Candidatus Saccharibacteria bacterium]
MKTNATLLIREPIISDKAAVWDYRQEFIRESSHIPGSGALGTYDTFEEWLEHVEENKKGSQERDLVKATQYLAYRPSDSVLVGVIQLRHSLNTYLEDFGGHIGYSVRPTERRKGYASAMLTECLRIAFDVGISDVLVTCDEENVASERVILKLGGVYEDSRTEPNGAVKKRFWIKTS